MSKKIISQKDAKEIARKNNLANVIIVAFAMSEPL